MPPAHRARIVHAVLEAIGSYAKIAWWGLVSPRVEKVDPLVVLQGVIRGEEGILLAVRTDLRGWELPGGTLEEGEGLEQALCREIREETGLAVAVDRHTGDYWRSGFRPHLARVYLCHPIGGTLETQPEETRALRWFPREALPETLFPWYRQPLEDALGPAAPPVIRAERQGVARIAAGLAIDLRMRLSGDRAGDRG